MRRIDYGGGGFWVRVGRWWYGLVASWPFVSLVPVIEGGSDGMASQGSYLLMQTAGSPGSPDTLLEISEVTNISGGGGTVERIDFTHLRSPGRRREFKPSFIEDGTLTFTVQYIPTDASHIQLLAYLDSGDEFALREVFPDATGWDYQGYMSGIVKGGQDVGGKIVLECTYQMTGSVDFTGVGSPV